MWKNLSHPKQIRKFTAVIICLSLACYQLSVCSSKLLQPPVLTHYNFELNETLNFPAVTVCRTSPYKSAVYEKYGLGPGGPGNSASWKTFDFDNYTVQEFFDEAVYKLEEVLPFYGFDSLMDDSVDITSFYRLYYGRCFTITPKNETTKWDSDGYFLYLTHTDESEQNGYDISIPGFHIYIHDRKEVFTGNVRNVGSFIDYMFGEIHEDIKLNLKVNVYEQISTSAAFCNSSYNYSFSKCQLACTRKLITEEVGCSAPWLPNPELQHCNDYNSIRSLLGAYDRYNWESYAQRCDCPQPCLIKAYDHYITSVKETSLRVCKLAMTFPTNLVIVVREALGYDWNLFIADLGGSLSFLLGISVLGLVKMCEYMIDTCKCRSTETIDDAEKKAKELPNKGSEEVASRKENQKMKTIYEQKESLPDQTGAVAS